MFITRAPPPTLGLCLGGILCIFPPFIATYMSSYSFPDGSICYVCNPSNWSEFYDCGVLDELESPGSALYCTAPNGDCDGTYYPPGDLYISSPRLTVSVNKCIYYSNNNDLDPSSDTDLSSVKTEDCCFKPGSQVCIFSCLVRYSGLMLVDLGPKPVYRPVVFGEWHLGRPSKYASKRTFSNIGTSAHRRNRSRYKVLPGAIRLLCIQGSQFPI